MIKFACPSCNKSMRVENKHAGKTGKCPKCGKILVVPEQSTLIQFDCEGCGHTLKLSNSYAGRTGRCPKCKNPVQVPAPHAEPSASETPTQPDTDEEDYEEEASYEESTGPDRRLVLIMASATILVVIGISLGIFLWPSESEPDAEPMGSQPFQEITKRESKLEPEPMAITSPLPERTVTPETSNATHLLFNPNPGIRRAMRATTQLVMSSLQSGQLQEITITQSITVDLDVQEPRHHETTTLDVTIRCIKVGTDAQGMINEYDSAKASSEDNPIAGFYSPFANKVFTIHVSRQGDIVNTGLDELYLTVAKDRVKAEDDMIRAMNEEEADAAVERTDQRFGSRDNRILAMKEQLKAFPLFGHEQVRRLLGDLIVPLPSQPLKNNMTWAGSITVKAEVNLDVPATYTVTSLDENTCTIKAYGERSEGEAPFVYQAGETTITSDLTGTSRVTLIVDRLTGWSKSKVQKTLLRGQMRQSQAGQADTETGKQVIMDITTTVEPIK